MLLSEGDISLEQCFPKTNLTGYFKIKVLISDFRRQEEIAKASGRGAAEHR